MRSNFSDLTEALAFLDRSSDHEKITDSAYDRRNYNLQRTGALLDRAGRPQEEMRILHVAGTKGKGSTCHLLERCLREAGLRTGLFTSPHLVSICERLRINGDPISRSAFCQLVETIRPHVERMREQGPETAPTYFEILTAMAIMHFAAESVDVSVLEVGLGGRLDSTNVITPDCSIITAIGYDHMDKLGDTIEEIAAEKGGIIKNNVPVIIGKQKYPEARSILQQVAREHSCRCWTVGEEMSVSGETPLQASCSDTDEPIGWTFDLSTPCRTYTRLRTSLLGRHQVSNCVTAIAALDMLRRTGRLSISSEQVEQGIARCRCPGRVELVAREPGIILDTAHTVESIDALVRAVRTHFPDRPVRMLFGCMRDKDAGSMIQRIQGLCSHITLTASAHSRAASPEALSAWLPETCSYDVECSPREAFQNAISLTRSGEVLCVTGSFYLAGEIRKILQSWDPSHLLRPVNFDPS
ncbi:MAG: bifunctional folylpolyglutamate synthase/dihydrofolate synthase [Planctomycetota bacterium]